MVFSNNRGNIFDSFSIIFILAFAVVVLLLFVLIIKKFSIIINADPAMPDAGKEFIGTIQSQNGWTMDFLFIMLLISLPLASMILAFFNNIPPFMFWASFGLTMLVVLFGNVLGDAYMNLVATGDMATITWDLPMTNYVMSHFALYSFIVVLMIIFGVYIKQRNQMGYSP